MSTELISIDKVTVSAILGGSLKSIFPELYRLNEVVESQDWHDDQSVFDHSIKTAQAIDSIAEFDFLESEARQFLRNYLDEMIGTHTRLELLKFAALFHDIGKNETLYHKPNGDTSCPSHAVIGGIDIAIILTRVTLSHDERIYIRKLIAEHLLPSDIIEVGINNKTLDRQILRRIEKCCAGYTIEAIVLSYADWLGCQVRDTVVVELNERVKAAQACLSYLSKDIKVYE